MWEQIAKTGQFGLLHIRLKFVRLSFRYILFMKKSTTLYLFMNLTDCF